MLVVIGTRPEAIKMAPVVEALRDRSDRVETAIALTGQHTDMVDQVLDAFGMTPDFDLGIMKEGQSLYDVGHGCLDGLRDAVRSFDPGMVLVQGDTATVFFGSLVGFFERTLVGHVEAGLRSHDRQAPYPEELFRRMTDALSDVHFVPTPLARRNLLAESTPQESIHVTGNTVVDALLGMVQDATPVEDEALRDALDGGRRLVLLTAHRRESFGEPLREVFHAVREVVERVPDIDVVYPVHPNPEVLRPARELLSDHSRIHLTAPMSYLDLLKAMQKASLVMTDSGGIQEEAPTFGVPVLVLREVTERPEGVDAGVTRLVGTNRERIVEWAIESLQGARGAGHADRPRNPYGDGRAGVRIADIVVHRLTGDPRETSDWDGGDGDG